MLCQSKVICSSPLFLEGFSPQELFLLLSIGLILTISYSVTSPPGLEQHAVVVACKLRAPDRHIVNAKLVLRIIRQR